MWVRICRSAGVKHTADEPRKLPHLCDDENGEKCQLQTRALQENGILLDPRHQIARAVSSIRASVFILEVSSYLDATQQASNPEDLVNVAGGAPSEVDGICTARPPASA